METAAAAAALCIALAAAPAAAEISAEWRLTSRTLAMLWTGAAMLVAGAAAGAGAARLSQRRAWCLAGGIAGAYVMAVAVLLYAAAQGPWPETAVLVIRATVFAMPLAAIVGAPVAFAVWRFTGGPPPRTAHGNG